MKFRIAYLYFILLGVLVISLEISAHRRNRGQNRHRGYPQPSHHYQDGYQDQGQEWQSNSDYGEKYDQVATDYDPNGWDQEIPGDPYESYPDYPPTTRRPRTYPTQRTRYIRSTAAPTVSTTTATSPQVLPRVSKSDGPEATTDVGTFRGKVITTPANKKVVAFLGIPFAKPPVGDLKFKKPVPLEKLETPFDAVDLPNACSQPVPIYFPGHRGEEQWRPNTNMSEDCLYLNIWVPATIFEGKEHELATVMFWIYGGGFFSGSNALDIYDGAVLASENEVIVVSPQYRLGPLGFLYFGIEDAPGNVGLLDQNLALKWTNDHIKNFGGDAESITIFGESAGAASVSYHSLSPLSKSLFKRAIMMSGMSTGKWAANHPSKAREISYRLAKLVGCNTKTSPQVIVDCLRKADVNQLTSLQWKLMGGKVLSFPFIPTVDGYFIKDMPINIVGTRDAKRHDLLVGSTKDEGSYFTLYKYYTYFSEKKPTKVPFDKYVDIMKEIFQDYSEFEQDLIIDFYTKWENPNDGYENQRIINQAVGDAYFTCPLKLYANIWANRGLRTYFYQFNQRTSSNPWPEWMGVMHGDEIDYAFGLPLRNSSMFNPEEAKLSTHMGKLFSQFAKTGTPSPKWERYTSDLPVYVNLNAANITDETKETELGPDADNCAFWNNMLPMIHEQLSNSNNEQQPNSIPISNSNRFSRFKKPAYRLHKRQRKSYDYTQQQCDQYQNEGEDDQGAGYQHLVHRQQTRQNSCQCCQNSSPTSSTSAPKCQDVQSSSSTTDANNNELTDNEIVDDTHPPEL